jgi:hypothetical protein
LVEIRRDAKAGDNGAKLATELRTTPSLADLLRRNFFTVTLHSFEPHCVRNTSQWLPFLLLWGNPRVSTCTPASPWLAHSAALLPMALSLRLMCTLRLSVAVAIF